MLHDVVANICPQDFYPNDAVIVSNSLLPPTTCFLLSHFT